MTMPQNPIPPAATSVPPAHGSAAARSGVVAGLISTGVVTAIVVAWTVVATVSARVIQSFDQSNLVPWTSLGIGMLFEAIFIVLLYVTARTRKKGAIAAGVAFGLFAVNRLLAVFLVVNYVRWLRTGVLFDIAQALGLFVFLVGLYAAWTCARSRSAMAWAGFGIATVLALILALVSYFIDPSNAALVTIFAPYFTSVAVQIGLITLVAIGIGLGIITAADAIGVRLARDSAPQAGRPLPGQFPPGAAANTFPAGPVGGYAPALQAGGPLPGQVPPGTAANTFPAGPVGGYAPAPEANGAHPGQIPPGPATNTFAPAPSGGYVSDPQAGQQQPAGQQHWPPQSPASSPDGQHPPLG